VSLKARNDSLPIASKAEVEQSQRRPLEQKAKVQNTTCEFETGLASFSLTVSSWIYFELAYRESGQESCIMRSCGRKIQNLSKLQIHYIVRLSVICLPGASVIETL